MCILVEEGCGTSEEVMAEIRIIWIGRVGLGFFSSLLVKIL